MPAIPDELVKRVEQAVRDGDPLTLREAAVDLRQWLGENPGDSQRQVFTAYVESLANIDIPPNPRAGTALYRRAPTVFADRSVMPTPVASPRPGWPFQAIEKPPGTIPHA